MKKRILATVLALIMTVGVFPLPASAITPAEFNAQYSSTVHGQLTSATDVDTYTFTVPCSGEVVLSTKVEGGYLYADIDVYKGNSIYESAKIVNLPISYKTLRTMTLSAGTYSVRVSFPSSKAFLVYFPERIYYIDWKFTCSHKNATETETEAATCSKEGTIKKTCNDCGYVLKSTPTDKLPHTPDGEWVTVQEPTCSAVGKRTQTCTVCNEVALEEDIDKLPHEAAWKTTQEATCAAQGRQNYICSVCGEVVETKSIPALEHTFGSWTVTEEGNCRKDGKRVRECSVCGERETQVLKAEDNHDWGRWQVRTKATCTEDGVEYRQCGECYKEETRTVHATGHSFGKWQAGKTEDTEVRVCADCGEKETRKAKTQPDKEDDRDGNHVSVTKANSTTPTVIVLVVPAFSDVSASSWYQSVVTYAYNLGLMVGTSETSFNPMGTVTVAEAITMAARARNSYEGGSNEDFTASSVWYQTYVDYAVKKNIIKDGDFDNYTRVATRAEMAYIFAHALPDSGMKAINNVKTLPDVDSSTKYSKEIFKLYNAGIITGSDAKGTFLPDNPITRSEAAAIITRVTLSSERKTLALK